MFLHYYCRQLPLRMNEKAPSAPMSKVEKYLAKIVKNTTQRSSFEPIHFPNKIKEEKNEMNNFSFGGLPSRKQIEDFIVLLHKNLEEAHKEKNESGLDFTLTEVAQIIKDVSYSKHFEANEDSARDKYLLALLLKEFESDLQEELRIEVFCYFYPLIIREFSKEIKGLSQEDIELDFSRIFTHLSLKFDHKAWEKKKPVNDYISLYYLRINPVLYQQIKDTLVTPELERLSQKTQRLAPVLEEQKVFLGDKDKIWETKLPILPIDEGDDFMFFFTAIRELRFLMTQFSSPYNKDPSYLFNLIINAKEKDIFKSENTNFLSLVNLDFNENNELRGIVFMNNKIQEGPTDYLTWKVNSMCKTIDEVLNKIVDEEAEKRPLIFNRKFHRDTGNLELPSEEKKKRVVKMLKSVIRSQLFFYLSKELIGKGGGLE